MTLNKSTVLAFAVLCGLLAVSALLILRSPVARGAQISDLPALVNAYRQYEFFQTATSTSVGVLLATSTSATSTNKVASFDANGTLDDGSFDVRGAKRIDVYFTRGAAYGGANQGTSTFAVQGSYDNGVTWYYLNRLISATTSPASTVSNAFVASSDPSLNGPITIGAYVSGNQATSTLHYSLDLSSQEYQKIRCIAVRATDGSNQCAASATF